MTSELVHGTNRGQTQAFIFVVVAALCITFLCRRSSRFSGMYTPPDYKNTSAGDPDYVVLHDFMRHLDDSNITCVEALPSVPVSICIYPQGADSCISRSIEKRGVWERDIHREILKFLNFSDKTGFVDIGANIGAHSLDVAKLGYSVIGVEPVAGNIIRIHKAVVLNGVQDRYTLLENALSNARGCVRMRASAESNKGTYVIVKNERIDCETRAAMSTKTILLDDLLDFASFTHAVLKVDAEGSEPDIFSTPLQFFNKVPVIAIFMEFQFLTKMFRTYRSVELYHKVQSMVDYFVHLGFVPYAIGSACELTSLWRFWPQDVVWIRKSAVHWYHERSPNQTCIAPKR